MRDPLHSKHPRRAGTGARTSPAPSRRRPTPHRAAARGPVPARRHRLAVVLAVLGALALGPRPAARAEPTETELRKAEALATEAKVFFRSRLFKEAALQFMEAFALSQRPALVYNAARAYEEGGYHSKAIALFAHYARLPDTDEAGRKAAGERRTRLQALLDAKKAAADRAARERRRKKQAAARKIAADKARREAREAARRATRARRQREREAAAAARERAAPFPTWRLAGAGGAALLGVASYLNALSLAGQMPLSDVKTPEDKARYRDLESDARLWRGLAVGAGVVCAGLGAWAAWDMWLAPKPGVSRVSFVPAVSGAAAGGTLRVSF